MKLLRLSMWSTSRSLICVLLATVVGLAACRRGDRAADAEASAPAAEAVRQPWEAIPQDSLYGATAEENLRVRSVELELRGVPRGWNGMRIAVLSDLLLGLWPDNARLAEAAVQQALRTEPDLVVLLGDQLGIDTRTEALDRVLAPLRGVPTLAVLGSRDLASEARTQAVVGRLAAHGVTVLRNQVVAFARGTDTAYVAGIEPAFAAFTPAQQAQLLQDLPEGAPTPLLISADPTVLPRLPEGRFPMVVAGQTFCGHIDVPGAPRLVTLAEETLAAERVRGGNRLYRSRGSTMFVTCGLGYSFVPARFAAAPEVALVTLIRIPDPRPEAADTLPATPAPTPQVEPETEPEPQ
jgi:uncharacterized protein